LRAFSLIAFMIVILRRLSVAERIYAFLRYLQNAWVLYAQNDRFFFATEARRKVSLMLND
jgi:hypothetical protein